MSETVLTYTYTGELRIVIDNDAPPSQKLHTRLHSTLTGTQQGFPQGAHEELAVQVYREKELDFRDDPLGYFLFLYHAGTPAHVDPLERQRTLLNDLHGVKNNVPHLPAWKRRVARWLGIIPMPPPN